MKTLVMNHPIGENAVLPDQVFGLCTQMVLFRGINMKQLSLFELGVPGMHVTSKDLTNEFLFNVQCLAPGSASIWINRVQFGHWKVEGPERPFLLWQLFHFLVSQSPSLAWCFMALGECSHPVWKFRTTALLPRTMFVATGWGPGSIQTTCGLPANERWPVRK